MANKQFKTESKKLMDLMINSIYTNKEIFLRELISNASDALDKLHYKSITESLNIDNDSYQIFISIDKDKRLIKISDTGCGMNKEELETNLGTIAKSGSQAFKEANEKKEDIDIIGQFGVGFYSAFMVASKIEVISKAYGSDEANCWSSSGVDGYSINSASKDSYGTEITLTIKEDSEDYNYSELLDTYKIQSLIKKYSNYITYPIKMEVTSRELKENSQDEYEDVTKIETINDMIPLWKKNKDSIKQEDYDAFYCDKFYDYEKPLSTIHSCADGLVSYNSLLFIPSHLPYDYYTKEYEKGLQLYSNGVLIMDKCKDLLPDYYGFIKGVVDSPDLSLNISREMLQQTRTLKTIANSLETKITKELENMLANEREKYENFFTNFGRQLKFGIYESYGMNKNKLQDLLLFTSSKDEKLLTLDEYVSKMKENQDSIYYVCGESNDQIDLLPIVEKFKDKDYEVLYCVDYIDEFTLQSIKTYKDKKLVNIAKEDIDLDTSEEKDEINKLNEQEKELLATMKEALKDIEEVRFTNKLKNHPVCLTSQGNVSIEMEKVINASPSDNKINAKKILEINASHKITKKIEDLYKNNKDELKNYAKILYAQARLIEGLPIDNPTEITNLICNELC